MNYTKQDLLVTSSGLEKIRQRLIELRAKHAQTTQELQAAREQGDLSENAEYDAAKETLAQVNEELQECSYIAENHILTMPPADTTVARFGAYVKVQQDTQEKTNTHKNKKVNQLKKVLEFKIASKLEATLEENTVWFRAPIAQAVTGKRVGDQFSVANTNCTLLRVIYSR